MAREKTAVDRYFDEQMKDPEFAAAYKRERAIIDSTDALVRSEDNTVLCIKGKSNGLSLTRGKRYRVIHNPHEEARGLLRVVDDTGEDYVYPAEFFATDG
jgi:hypothetical protein